MDESYTTTRATIQIGTQSGTLIVDGFMLSDGSYRMSLSQSAGAVGVGPQNASDFLRLKAAKLLLDQGDGVNNIQIELAHSTHTHGRSRLRTMSLEAVTAYWKWQAFSGNRDALSLCRALMRETLARRFDHAFGVERSALDDNHRSGDQVFQRDGDMDR